MSESSTRFPTSKRPTRLVWTLTILLVAVVVRRTYVLLYPQEQPKFDAAAALDAGFAAHPFLTFLHILPAALLICLVLVQTGRDRG